MFHKNRTWRVGTVATPQELAEKLTKCTWTLCSGFKVEGFDYLFLNDSTHEDGAGEYGVVKQTPDGFVQVESITFSWTSTEKALAYILEALAGGNDEQGWPVTINLDTQDAHRCGACA